jgi:two-component system chemotaxis response regulator CheY
LAVPIRVLLVEDHADTRELIAMLLHMEGYVVATAGDGQEGVAQASLQQPDIIVTDINMPRLSGIDMIRMLRQQPEFNSVPILVMTAYGDDIARDAVASGATQALPKPVDFDSLVGAIKDLLYQ